MSNSSDERILFHLKTRGPQTASDIGTHLGMTPTGSRQHLAKLARAGLVDGDDRHQTRGRPKKYWRLTERGHGRFPDRHADLTRELLKATQAIFDKAGVDRLIRHREGESLTCYREGVAGQRSLRDKLAALAGIRSREGYMASLTIGDDGAFLFVEDHCPICAAAESCQALCRSELAIFRKVLGKGIVVERVDHLLAGARRCAYRITQSG